MKSISVIAKLMILVLSLAQYSLADESKSRTISVSGESEIMVTPDKVEISIGIESHDKNIVTAKQTSDDLISRLISAANKYSINKDDIQTDYINIEPRWVKDAETSEFLGHFIRRTVNITLREIAKFDDLMSDLVSVGEIRIHSVSFQTTELRKYRDQARSMAIKAAFEKATALASELGQKVGKPLTISEGYSRWYSPYSYWNQWGRSSVYNVQNVAEAPSSAETPMAAGKISVTASVSVSFELE